MTDRGRERVDPALEVAEGPRLDALVPFVHLLLPLKLVTAIVVLRKVLPRALEVGCEVVDPERLEAVDTGSGENLMGRNGIAAPVDPEPEPLADRDGTQERRRQVGSAPYLFHDLDDLPLPSIVDVAEPLVDLVDPELLLDLLKGIGHRRTLPAVRCDGARPAKSSVGIRARVFSPNACFPPRPFPPLALPNTHGW